MQCQVYCTFQSLYRDGAVPQRGYWLMSPFCPKMALQERVRLFGVWRLVMTANEDNFDTLIERYRNMAYRLAYGRLGDEQLAEDAVQEAFITAYTHLDELRDPLAFPAWFKQIVLTSCSRLTRRKHLATTDLEDEHDAALSTPDP